MFERVRPGAPLKIPAADWNACLAVAESYSRQQAIFNAGPLYYAKPTITTPAKNIGESIIEAHRPAAIVGSEVDPGKSNARQKNPPWILKIKEPKPQHRLCIATEPIKPGKVGEVAISGIWITLITGEGTHASMIDAPTLKAGPAGACEILAFGSADEQVSDARWAVVRIIGESVTQRYVKITAVHGVSPPFIYSGEEVLPTSDGGWEIPENPKIWSANLYNIGEDTLPGCGKVEIGRVVIAWPTPFDWRFQVLNYRGTYG